MYILAANLFSVFLKCIENIFFLLQLCNKNTGYGYGYVVMEDF